MPGDPAVVIQKGAGCLAYIVSTTIREDGSRILTHNIGKNQSEKARKEIEVEFGLIKAERQQQASQPVEAIGAEKIIYGKAELKESIDNIVSTVFYNYKYSSLTEFNAVLRQFNVLADRGSENGKIFKNRGLLFRALDERGNKIGVPLKASLLSSKPTLDNLEKKFFNNRNLKEPLKQKIRNAIDRAAGSSLRPDGLRDQLQKQNIFMQTSEDEAGNICGITFIDNEAKVVFNGSDLGEQYEAGILLKNHKEKEMSADIPQRPISKEPFLSNAEQLKIVIDVSKVGSMGEERSREDLSNQSAPFQLTKRKKKKKKPNQNRSI